MRFGNQPLLSEGKRLHNVSRKAFDFESLKGTELAIFKTRALIMFFRP